MEAFEPYNQEAEEALVGAFFLEGELVKECTLRPEQLYSRKLRVIYSAIRILDDKGKPIDVITVCEEIGLKNLEWLGGVSYMTQLAGGVPTTANFHFYEKMVREYAQKKRRFKSPGKLLSRQKN